ncbi:MAG: glycine cleavage system aminomethyltransferase GcvT [Clostridiales bacterium]
MKKTVLFNKHKQLGGKIIDFGDWLLPVQYSEGILFEHKKVREAVGLFDVSHMGEIIVKGLEAKEFIQFLITNDINKIKQKEIIYSPLCYESAGVVDDVLIYKFSEEEFLLIVNAANIQKDFEWLENNKGNYKVKIDNLSDEYSQLAIQGPKSEIVLQQLTDIDLSKLKFYCFNNKVFIAENEVIISRTGYTGEDGFEIYSKNENIANIWDEIMKEGYKYGIVPVGLGARDTLRFEAALPLYGHELTKDINPIEAGLEKFIKLKKDNFMGKENLNKYINNKYKKILVGFEMLEKGIPRAKYDIYLKDEKIGHVTSGSYSPTNKRNLGLGLIREEYSQKDNIIEIMIRNQKMKAKIINKPFYNKKYKIK